MPRAAGLQIADLQVEAVEIHRAAVAEDDVALEVQHVVRPAVQGTARTFLRRAQLDVHPVVLVFQVQFGLPVELERPFPDPQRRLDDWRALDHHLPQGCVCRTEFHRTGERAAATQRKDAVPVRAIPFVSDPEGIGAGLVDRRGDRAGAVCGEVVVIDKRRAREADRLVNHARPHFQPPLLGLVDDDLAALRRRTERSQPRERLRHAARQLHGAREVVGGVEREAAFPRDRERAAGRALDVPLHAETLAAPSVPHRRHVPRLVGGHDHRKVEVVHAPGRSRLYRAVREREPARSDRERAAGRRREREVVRRVEQDAARSGAGRRHLRRRSARGECQHRRAVREIGQHVPLPVRRRREGGVRAAAVPRGARQRRRTERGRPRDDLLVRHGGHRLARLERG